MLTVSKGEKILCQQGHVCGELDVDVHDNDIIRPDMLRLNLFKLVDFTPNMDGHICKSCNEQITELRNEAYRVRTAHGWVGKIPS
jgi:hypothetical protein